MAIPNDNDHPNASDEDASGGGDVTRDYAGETSDRRIVDLLDQYMADLKAGKNPDRNQMLADHPELAESLEACLAGIEFIRSVDVGDTSAPQRLGDFRILREVGRGGMGVVYEATQISLGRKVALKVLRFGGVSDPGAIDRFQREAETVARLHHTNIVPIFSVGNDNGVNYYAMQFIDGRGLDQVLKDADQPIDADVLADWGLQAAEALAHAHQRNVIHRDVKPSNLLLDDDGRIWLTDFGLAKRADDVTLSMTGALLGTPRYMSPEQASATKREIDHRTDVYSLGATLYEIATGHPVFSAATPHGVISQILTSEPEPPRKHRPSLPRDFETILSKCLCKDARQRYGSAKELAIDFRAFQENRPIKARRPSVMERAARWVSRRKQSVGLTAAAVATTLLIVAGCLIGWYGYSQSQLAYLSLTTDSPPLVAEVLDEFGNHVVMPETVPTQQRIEVPSGEAFLRVSGDDRLSQTSRIDLPARDESKLKLELDDQLAWNPIDIERSFAIADFGGRVDPILLTDTGLSRIDGTTGVSEWTCQFTGQPHPMLESIPGFIWPWIPQNRTGSHGGFGKFDSRPMLVSAKMDVDGDGHNDIVIAAKHQAWLLSVSGSDGKLLWVAGRANELAWDLDANRQRPRTSYSTTVAPPLVIADIDNDGVPDVVSTFADRGGNKKDQTNPIMRWLEVVSGATGETIWRHDFIDSLFDLPQSRETPYAFRWFTQPQGGYTSGGGGGMSTWGNRARRHNRSIAKRDGLAEYLPGVAADIAIEISGELRSAIAVLAGSKILVLDSATGNELLPPTLLKIPPDQPIRWGDVDGDGATDAVVVNDVGTKTVNTANGMLTRDTLRVEAWSPSRATRLWHRDVNAFWPHRRTWSVEPPSWPLMEDLDDDGVVEVILPTGTSEQFSNRYGRTPWGDLSVLDGRTGKTRWTHRVLTLDQHVDHFVIGSDIDEDGVRDVFAAVLWGNSPEIYIEAISGNDGKQIWFGRRSFNTSVEWDDLFLGGVQLWNAGTDGWPQLVVSVYHEHGESPAAGIHLFSSRTGKCTSVGRRIEHFKTADITADGVDDLVVFKRQNPMDGLDDGGTLSVLVGVAAEPWRRQGDQWMPAADFNGDGLRDLIRSDGRGSVQTMSADSGARIWETSLSARGDNVVFSMDTLIVDANTNAIFQQPLPPKGDLPPSHRWDLNSDGIADLLVANRRSTRDPRPLLRALSGRSGQELWVADLNIRIAERFPMTTCRDLDGDGRSEVIIVAAMDLDYPPRIGLSSSDQQLWLVTLSGASGKTIWKHPLTRPYGNGRGGGPGSLNSFPYDLDRFSLETSFQDLNGDGSLDFVLLAEDGQVVPMLEWHAFNGIDGRVLWRRPVPMFDDQRTRFRAVAPTLPVDLDGDGTKELIAVAFEHVRQRTNQRHFAHVYAFRAIDGEALWHWKKECNQNAGVLSRYSNPADVARRVRPQLMRVKNARPRIVVNLWSDGKDILVLDHTGQPIPSPSMSTLDDELPHRFRPWPCDIDGDGTDELILLRGNRLTALGGDNLDRELWRAPAKTHHDCQILGIAPLTKKMAPVVVLNRGTAAGEIVGVRASDGQVVWRCPMPKPRHKNARLSVSTVGLLSPSSKPPRLFFGYAGINTCRLARTLNGGQDSIRSSLAVTLPNAMPDPRRMRRLPWAEEFPNRQKLEIVTPFIWAGVYAVLLLIIPFSVIRHFAQHGRWSLRWMMALPLVAGVMLLTFRLPGPDNNTVAWTVRLSMAIAAFPVLLTLGLLASWCLRRKWWSLCWWFCVTLIVAVGLATMAFWTADFAAGEPLQAGESYSWNGWYLIWFLAAYLAAWGLAIIEILKLLVKGFSLLIRKKPAAT